MEPHTPTGSESPPWQHPGVIPLRAPPERPQQDLRFRPSRGPEESVCEKSERTRKALDDQCRYARIPGYTGYVPAARAEDIYGHTKAHVGERAASEHARRYGETAQVRADGGRQSRGSSAGSSGRLLGRTAEAQNAFPEEHPLGKSCATSVRSHWVPTIPGYGGSIPGKYAENVMGGGVAHTCKMAGHAIAERSLPAGRHEHLTMQDYAKHSRIADYYHAENRATRRETHPERVRLAADVRAHCERQIPGYTGHVPRCNGESIFGATARVANQIAADLHDDKVFNPVTHHVTCCKPQCPPIRPLRF